MTAEACGGCASICPAVRDDGRPGCPRPRLLPDCEPLVRAYMACHTQWRASANGARLGLDYTACAVAIKALRPAASARRRARLLRGVQVIEAALLAVQAEAAAPDAPQRRGGFADGH